MKRILEALKAIGIGVCWMIAMLGMCLLCAMAIDGDLSPQWKCESVVSTGDVTCVQISPW